MTCIRIPQGFVCVGGPDRKIRDQSGTEFTFEDHRIFGPFVLDKHGDPKSKQPGEKASFWRVYQWWCQQGKEIDDSGFCVWAEPAQTHKAVHMGGRHYRLEKL